ncbi:MAG: glutamyl-tRNA reductase [Elusimicrobiota bacterium]
MIICKDTPTTLTDSSIPALGMPTGSHLHIVGTNHKTGSIQMREALAKLWGGNIKGAMQAMRSRFGGRQSEICILSTCNRYEIYAVGDPGLGRDIKTALLAEVPVVTQDEAQALYAYQDEDALDHLFRVASGLDSMVIGETEILGQVKNAYEVACSLSYTKGILNTVMQKSLYVGKKTRTQTELSRGKISVASVALDLATKIYADFNTVTIAVVGAGAMGLETARNLLHSKPKSKIFLSRTLERAEALATEFGGTAKTLEDLPEVITASDILVTQLATETPVITQALLKPLLHGRQRALFILDIAMPRNVAEDVATLSGVYLYNLNDLKDICDANMRNRSGEVDKAVALIRQELSKFLPNYFRRLLTISR